MITTITMAQGTWIYQADNTLAHNGDDYMRLGFNSTYECRPVINFTNTLYSGEILSATLNLYCSDAGSNPQINAYKVNRDFAINCAWGAGYPWTTAGCNAIAEDRSNTNMTGGTRAAAGWVSVPITDLTELLAVTEGKDTILLVPDSRAFATISKSPAPYLEIVTLDPTGIIMF